MTEVRPEGHPHSQELEAERAGWYELVGLLRGLTPDECLIPGYYRDPDWSVRDVVAHLGTWLAEAAVQFERMHAGTYEGHDMDIDAMNASLLEGMRDQPWTVAWTQAQAGRTWLLKSWYALSEPSDEAAWWIRKSGPEHYAEHVGRLREWTEELTSRRRA